MDGYVFRDNTQKEQIESWIKDKAIPHLIFSGNAGIGKTTLAKILINQLEVNEYDVLEINASRTNSVDDVRDKITNFVQMIPFGPFKVVLLDEADYLTHNAQAVLRGVMEQYASVLRFIITCNYPQKIIPALHSRCQGFAFKNLNEDDFILRVGRILASEEIDFEVDTLKSFVKAHYPDLRKTINSVQQASATGKLIMPESAEDEGKDYRLEMVALFRQGRIRDARRLICSQVSLDEYEDIYRFMYRNLEFWGKDDNEQDEAILIIRQGLINHGICADPEINLSATFVELEKIGK